MVTLTLRGRSVAWCSGAGLIDTALAKFYECAAGSAIIKILMIVVGIAISALFIAFIPSVEMVAHDDRTPVAYPAASRGTLSLTSRARSNSIRATI